MKRFAFYIVPLLAGWIAASPGHGADPATEAPARVESVRLGPHPSDTRLLIALSRPVDYQVKADLPNKKITFIFPGAVLDASIEPRTYRDKSLAFLAVERIAKAPKVTVGLQSASTRFFHYLDAKTSQVVVDLKPPGAAKASAAATAAPTIAPAPAPPKAPAKATLPPRSRTRTTRIAGLSDKQISGLSKRKDDENIRHGQADYLKALKQFQARNYSKAAELFDDFRKKHPASRHQPEVLYLKAESLYQAARLEANPVYDSALDAYKFALRESPGSRFARHAQYKIAQIYNEIGYTIEAKALYEAILKKNADDPYNQARQIDLASMLMSKGKYDEAYEAYQMILRDAPKNLAARDAIFTIARHYYDAGNFSRALKIYQEGAARWPSQLNEQPEIHFYMGQIHFSREDYSSARLSLYQLANLAPEDPRAHRALNLIGDSYLIENQDLKALSVFDESARRKPKSAEGRYALIRMADIGVRSPNLPVKDYLVDATAYHNPFKTYQTISTQAGDVDTLAEITLSRGNSYLEQQSYLKALEEFKKLLPLGRDSEHYPRARTRIIETLKLLVDKYSNQGGALPILYSYSDFVSLSLGDLTDTKTLLQIGEAYQAIGIFPEALNFYERVKLKDPKNVYSDRIFLNLGEIYLERKNFKDVETVAKAFLKKFPNNPRAAEAMKILGKAYWGQKKLTEAVVTFQGILKKHPKDTAEVHYLLAEANHALNRNDKAIREYQRSIDAFDPDVRTIPAYISNAYYKLGATYHEAGKYPLAIKALDRARKLFPENAQKPWADYLIADSHEQMKNTRGLTRELKRLADSDTSDDLMKQAAENKLKVLDWEKNIKTRL
jgi:tetratricopeptide (TPR) repeat protein